MRTIIYDGNHEATKKNHTFFSNLKQVTSDINPLVEVIDKTYFEDSWVILPYADLHRKESDRVDRCSSIIYSCSWRDTTSCSTRSRLRKIE